MGTTITCFFMEPTNFAEAFLRRYASPKEGTPACPGKFGYHNMSLSLGRWPWQPGERGLNGYQATDLPHDDPRWPQRCPCGYEFLESDKWQVNVQRLFRRTDTGEMMTLGNAPSGAMWYADWYPTTKGPDGHNLVVKTPAGDWLVDAPSDSGGHWKRTGKPPHITASPSIGMYGPDGNRWAYHAWLRDGQLVEC